MATSCWSDIADLSNHCTVFTLQALKISLGQQPSVTGMVHQAPHARAVHMATGLVIEVMGCENWQ